MKDDVKLLEWWPESRVARRGNDFNSYLPPVLIHISLVAQIQLYAKETINNASSRCTPNDNMMSFTLVTQVLATFAVHADLQSSSWVSMVGTLSKLTNCELLLLRQQVPFFFSYIAHRDSSQKEMQRNRWPRKLQLPLKDCWRGLRHQWQSSVWISQIWLGMRSRNHSGIMKPIITAQFPCNGLSEETKRIVKFCAFLHQRPQTSNSETAFRYRFRLLLSGYYSPIM